MANAEPVAVPVSKAPRNYAYLGVLVLMAILGAIVIPLLDSDPETQPDFKGAIGGVVSAVGGQ